MLAGVGTATTTDQFPGGTLNGVAFAATGDGNSAQDYRLYNGSTTQALDASFAAGSRNAADPYYTSRYNGAVPAAQLALYPQQTGTVMPGALGFAWHSWEIVKTGTTVTWSVDGSLIATATNANPTGSNIFLGYFDTNGTISTDPNARKLLFGLVDNVVVNPQAVPEPGTITVLALGGAALLRRRRKA